MLRKLFPKLFAPRPTCPKCHHQSIRKYPSPKGGPNQVVWCSECGARFLVDEQGHHDITAMDTLEFFRLFYKCESVPLEACPQCRYDLTGNVSGTCPECGERITDWISIRTIE